jgi:hypothetical protein
VANGVLAFELAPDWVRSAVAEDHISSVGEAEGGQNSAFRGPGGELILAAADLGQTSFSVIDASRLPISVELAWFSPTTSTGMLCAWYR